MCLCVGVGGGNPISQHPSWLWEQCTATAVFNTQIIYQGGCGSTVWGAYLISSDHAASMPPPSLLQGVSFYGCSFAQVIITRWHFLHQDSILMHTRLYQRRELPWNCETADRTWDLLWLKCIYSLTKILVIWKIESKAIWKVWCETMVTVIQTLFPYFIYRIKKKHTHTLNTRASQGDQCNALTAARRRLICPLCWLMGF